MRRQGKDWLLMTSVVMAFGIVSPAAAQTCSVSITNMSFGNVDTLSGAATDTTASIAYNCSGRASERILICVHLGEGSVPASGNRRMFGGSTYLSYQLYRGPDRSAIWGSAATGHPPEPIIANLVGGSDAGSVPLYGRVFGGQSSVEPASYASNFAGGNIEVRYRITDASDCSDMVGTVAPSPAFDVLATVAKECFVTTEPVAFGSHGVLNRNVDAEGAVNVRCTPSTGYTIRLNGGGAEASPTERQMSKGAESIRYGLYRDSAREQPWGDTEGTGASGNGSGIFSPHVVYGRVPAQATPSPGLYTDTVIVTVDYD
jgi:spore coat protein U-like protein